MRKQGRLPRALLAAGLIAVSGLVVLGFTSPSQSGIHWHQVSSASLRPAIQELPSGRLATPTALAGTFRPWRTAPRRPGFASSLLTASVMDFDSRMLPSSEALLPFADYKASEINEAVPIVTANPTQRAYAPETPTANVITRANFPQWAGVLEKSWAWDVMFESACSDIMARPCHLNAWQDFLDGLRGANAEFQLASVNREINRVRYREDAGNWGYLDYWAAPGEFFAAGGDCEDYAIAKYYSLKALGFAADQMRIVVLQDELRQRPHAVLVINFAGEQLMLDNMTNSVVPWSAAQEYRPYYSVNEEAFWLHEGREIS